jgi:diguanylate cyclase (GGDEF)-like protein
MSVVRAFILLLLCVAWPVLALGQATPLPSTALDLLDVGAPSFTNFSPRDGLPDTVMVAIRTDRDGFVWAASPEGVFRYDGRRWVASQDPAMAHDVDSLWLDSHGTLWAAFRSRGLASYDGAHWHVENLDTGLPSQQVRRFAESFDAQGHSTLWAVTWNRGLMVRRNGRWRADPDNPSLPSGTVLSMVQTQHIGGQRRLWVGMGSQGLWYRDEGTQGWRQWHAKGIDSTQVEYLLATMRHGHEELWISVFGSGLYRLSDHGLRRWSKESGELPTNEIYDIAATPLPDNDSAIWVSSRSGLLRVHDERVQVFDRSNGLLSAAVRGINAWRSPSGNDVIWLATEAGISRTVIGANPWSTASLLGARSIGVFGVLVEADGSGGERLWVGASEDGLGLYEHGQWRYFTSASGALPAASVSMIAVTTDRDGKHTHWIGMRGGELLRASLRSGGLPVFETQKTPWPKVNGQAVMDTLVRTVDGHEERWVATRQSGAYRWRDGHWTAFRADGARGQWGVIKLQEQVDPSGRSWLWASTNQGLARFDGQQWTLFGHAAGLADANLIGLSLITDARGHPVLWMGTSSAGIARADVSDPRHPVVLPNTLPPAPDAGTYDALRDSTGRIYICTNNGVQQLTPTASGYRSKVFTRRNGMVHDECNTNARFIDAHDRYWTGTLGGLTVYDPNREARDTQSKPLRITGVSVDGKPVAVEAINGSGLHVAAGEKSIEIQFALLSWDREDESRFRTQLLGFDDAPDEWNTHVARSFNALPPGSYRLYVEARDYAGNISAPINLPVIVEAQWWQRIWARGAAVLALLLLAYTGVQWRTRTLQTQRQALEHRVAARTVELDMANARLVELSYHDALTAVANRRRLLEQLQQLNWTTDSGAPIVHHALILVDVDHFKACNDRFGHPAGDEVLRTIAATMLRCAPDDALVARYGGEEFACLLRDADSSQAVVVAERMRVAVAACQIPVPDEAATMQVTISAGVASTACQNADYTHHHLLRDADLALYQAKHNGRNRVRERQSADSSRTKSDGS